MISQQWGRKLQALALGRSVVRGLQVGAAAVFVALPASAAPPVTPQPVPDAHSGVQSGAWSNEATVDAASARIGEGVYDNVCSACHEAGVNRAPTRFILKQMTPDAIHEALTHGVMKAQGSGLTEQERVSVAEYLSAQKLGAAAPTPPLMCTGVAARFDRTEPPVLRGWGFDAPSSHAVPTAVAGLTRANLGRLKLKWSVAFPNALRARSQPALAGGAVFVGSHDGTVYALDRRTGCARWTFRASGEVRTGIVIDPWKAGDASARPRAYFGDLLGNLYAVDAFTGRLAWRKTTDSHPSTTITATPTLRQGVLYAPVSSLEEAAAANPKYGCCTFRGSVLALDAASGRERWRTYFTAEPKEMGVNGAGTPRFGPSGVAIWSSVAVDEKRGSLYVTTGDSYTSPASPLSDAIVALDIRSGRIKWAYQAEPKDAWNVGCSNADKSNCPEENGPDFDFGAGAVLVRAASGREIVAAGQKSGMAYGVDPDSGKLVWKERIGRGGVVGGIHFGLAAANGLVFVPVSDVPDRKTYATPPKPGLYALEAASGRFVWRAPSVDICGGRPFCHPGYSGAISATPELVFAGSNDGYLRIYDAASGAVLWQADTTGPVRAVNGVAAHGGSMGGGAAPVAYGGMLFMPSGYGFAGKMPGNVLLAYSVE